VVAVVHAVGATLCQADRRPRRWCARHAGPHGLTASQTTARDEREEPQGTASIAYSILETHANGHAALAIRRSSPSRPVLGVRCWGQHWLLSAYKASPV